MNSDSIKLVTKTLNKVTFRLVNSHICEKCNGLMRHVFISELSEINNSKFLSRRFFVKTW